MNRTERARLRVQCSIDIQHQVASRLSVEEYVARCHAAVRHLTTAGFPVFTRSIVTSRTEFLFFQDHVLPLFKSGVTLGASVQPDIYDLPAFADAFRRDELGDMGARLGKSYLRQILTAGTRDPREVATASLAALRTAPWVFIEVNSGGVKGPSGFVAKGEHYPSVLAMLRSYRWLEIADTIVPQITISQNAFLYRIDRRNGAVTLNKSYLLLKLLQRQIGLTQPP